MASAPKMMMIRKPIGLVPFTNAPIAGPPAPVQPKRGSAGPKVPNGPIGYVPFTNAPIPGPPAPAKPAAKKGVKSPATGRYGGKFDNLADAGNPPARRVPASHTGGASAPTTEPAAAPNPAGSTRGIKKPTTTKSTSAPTMGSPAPTAAPRKIGKTTVHTRTAPAAAAPAAGLPGAPSADSIYAPAFGALDTAGQRLEAGRQAAAGDLTTYGQWAAGEEAKTRDWLANQFKGSADAAAKGYADLGAGAAQRAAETTSVTGGNADLERLSGVDTAQAQDAAQATANQTNAGAGALSRAALARQYADQTAIRDAYLANLHSGVSAAFNDKMAGLDTTRANLTVDKGKLAADLSATAAKNALDQRVASAMMQDRALNTDVNVENARTRRLQVLTTADAARERARLTAEIAGRRLDIQGARLQMDAYMKGQGLTLSQRRLELQKLTQESRARTGAASLLDNLYDKTYGTKGTRVWDKDRNQDRQFVRQLVTSLHGRYPNLSQAEAIQIISGRFPGALRVDPNDKYPLLQQVRALWQQ